jgi:hypothetical protein
MNGFGIQKCRTSYREEIIVLNYCILNRIPYKFCKKATDLPKDFIPVGSTKWCENFIDKNRIIPDYYPLFLKDYMFRKVWKTNKWPNSNVFIKPSDRFKRFTGFVINGESKRKRGPFWCSEVVTFINEWRYYILNGEIIAAEWYSGDEINEPEAPQLNINIPNSYCGALDFGLLNTGKLALVEANFPYSCGWYGKNDKLYIKWLINGWKYMI